MPDERLDIGTRIPLPDGDIVFRKHGTVEGRVEENSTSLISGILDQIVDAVPLSHGGRMQ